MPTSHASDQLRARAAALRRWARNLDDANTTRLPSHAGADTWIGPTAERFQQDVWHAIRELRSAADDLRNSARRLEARADDLDAAQASLAVAGRS